MLRPSPFVLALTCLLGACATPLPPVTWVRLPVDDVVATPAASVPTREVWQLMAPVLLPGHLDRDALLVPSGAAGLQPLGGVRWAEPLRDAVPRLLRADLSRLLGTPLWTAPLPPGVTPTRQLRVEFLALDVTPDGRGVTLQARWSLADPAGGSAPALGEASFIEPAASAQPGALAAAHRSALRRLAVTMAQPR